MLGKLLITDTSGMNIHCPATGQHGEEGVGAGHNSCHTDAIFYYSTFNLSSLLKVVIIIKLGQRQKSA